MEKIIPSATRRLIILLLLISCTRAFGQNKDIEWLRSLNVNRNTALDGGMHAITQSTYPIAVAIPVAQLAYGYIGKHKEFVSNGWQSVAGLGIAAVITYGLKYTVQRERPYAAYSGLQPYETETSPSFPSGHTAIAFATATNLSLQYHKWYVVAPSYAWAAAVGYSRLHLGAHYPSDVLAAAVIGAGSAYLSYKGNQWLQKRKNKKTKAIEH